MYIFRPFNKDPMNPWSRPVVSMRVGTLGVILVLAGLAFASVDTAKDFLFMPGSAVTDAQFIRITHRDPTTKQSNIPRYIYFADYDYKVNGKTYKITQTDTEYQGLNPQFHKTIRVAYKAADPAHAMIIYGRTLFIDARGSIVDGLVVGLGGYSFMYIIGFIVTKH
jgi:hypothetical protein